MKTSKSELVYLILSIFLIVIACGTYIIFGNKNVSPVSSVTTKQTTSQTSSEQDKENITTAEAAVKKLEANLNQETLTAATQALSPIKDKTTKAKLQTRIDAASKEVQKIKDADEAVKTAETEQTTASITAAQAAIDSLTNETKKTEFQDRLDTLTNSIAQANASYDNSAGAATYNSGNYSNQVQNYPQ